MNLGMNNRYTEIQKQLDHILNIRSFASVDDLIHYWDLNENVVIVHRKRGHKGCVVDIEGLTIEQAVNAVMNHPAVY